VNHDLELEWPTGPAAGDLPCDIAVGSLAHVLCEQGATIILASPFLEEVVKHAHPFVTPVIMAYEAAYHVLNHGPLWALAVYGPAAVMHIVTHRMTFRSALVTHVVFNALVTLAKA